MNKKNITLLAAAVSMIAVLSIPLLASAQTSTLSDLQAQVAALLSQLSSLQSQIRQIKASSTPPGGDEGNASGTPTSGHPICIGFNRNLSIGSQGSDVSDLQKTLAEDPSVYPSGTVTGYFGPLTAKAVMLFQEKNNIASSSTGVVGPLTRNFLMNHCGGPGPVKLPPMSASGTPWEPPHPPQPAASNTNPY